MGTSYLWSTVEAVCTDDHLNTFEQEVVYDAKEEEECVQGDDGPLLVTRRACFTPRKSEIGRAHV